MFYADSSTCFRRYPHPSSGAHSSCNYIWHWSNRICYRPLTWRSRSCSSDPPLQRTVAKMVRPMPDVVNTVWMCSWWWYHPKNVELSAENIIKLYIVASPWTIIDLGTYFNLPHHDTWKPYFCSLSLVYLASFYQHQMLRNEKLVGTMNWEVYGRVLTASVV